MRLSSTDLNEASQKKQRAKKKNAKPKTGSEPTIGPLYATNPRGVPADVTLKEGKLDKTPFIARTVDPSDVKFAPSGNTCSKTMASIPDEYCKNKGISILRHSPDCGGCREYGKPYERPS